MRRFVKLIIPAILGTTLIAFPVYGKSTHTHKVAHHATHKHKQKHNKFKLSKKIVDRPTSEIHCLAANIQNEAGGESKNGQLSVAHVIRNRIKSGKFASSYCGVTYQRGQFSWVGRKAARATPQTLQLASAFISNPEQFANPVGSALFFHSGKRPRGWGGKYVTRIGGHHFYR